MRLSSVYNTKDAESNDEIVVPERNTTEESVEQELPSKVKLTVATSSGRKVLDKNQMVIGVIDKTKPVSVKEYSLAANSNTTVIQKKNGIQL